MTDPVITLEGVDKIYRLGAERINLRAALPGRLGRKIPADGHAALRNVSLQVAPAESVGIIGRNGAGKSTLLKMVAKVIAPTRGSVVTRGVVASLIELGAGFHPDLTGSENVRFAAVLLGMSSTDITRRYDEIVAFAGIERFMDTPVKRYSSGMMARLGFAVASHLDADILAVDEVLSVGDSEFQRRCHERVTALRNAGCAVLFVTHNTWIIPQVCQRAIWLDLGRIVYEGDPEEVVTRYRHSSAERDEPYEAATDQHVDLESVSLSPSAIAPAEAVMIDLTVRVTKALHNSRVILAITRHDEFVCTGLEVPGSEGILRQPGEHRILGRLASLPLRPGEYRVWLGVIESATGPVLHAQATRFLAVVGDVLPPSTYGLVAIEAEWSFEELSKPSNRRDHWPPTA